MQAHIDQAVRVRPLVHRVRLKDEAEMEGVTLQTVLDGALEQVTVPTGVR